MAASFNIQKIFRESWGYNPPIFDVALQPEQSANKREYYGKGLYGRPYFMPVKLGTTVLPNPVIRITNKKTIVETAMVNRSGTVKELVKQEDYRINIKGIIIREDNSFPEKEIKDIQKLYNDNIAYRISCALTDIFLTEDNRVIITDITWPEISGSLNVKTYEMNLISDRPFNLIL